MRAMGVSRRSTQLIALAVIRTAAITHADQIQTPYTAFHLPPHSVFLRRGVYAGKLLAYTARLRVSTRFSGVMRRLLSSVGIHRRARLPPSPTWPLRGLAPIHAQAHPMAARALLCVFASWILLLLLSNFDTLPERTCSWLIPCYLPPRGIITHVLSSPAGHQKTGSNRVN